MTHNLENFLKTWNDSDDYRESRTLDYLEDDGRERNTPMERLEDARPRFVELVRNMAPDIESGRWDLLVGDDVSGRSGTLLLQRIISRVYKDHGYTPIKTYFLAFGRDLPTMPLVRQQLVDYVSQAKGKFERALFVTDNVSEGNTISFATGIFHHAAHIPMDVASFVEDKGVMENIEARLSSDLGDTSLKAYSTDWKYWGDRPQLHGGTFLPRLRHAIGVDKYDDSPTTESRRAHDIRAAHAGKLIVDHTLPINPDVVAFRRKIEEMADEIYEEVFGSPTETA